MLSTVESLSIIIVVALCTFLTRALPFLVFQGPERLPKRILYLGKVLPMAIMLCLIIYCIRDADFLSYPYGIPEILGILAVIRLHVWKRNTIISIIGGTVFYMILVQGVF